MKRLGCSAYAHLDDDRKKILDSSTTPNHSNHGADFGECNSLIFKAKIKENSQTLDCRPEKVIMATTKQSKDFLNKESIAKLPQKDSLRRGIRRQQAAIHPRAPQTLEDIEEIPQKYAFIDHEKFLPKNMTTKSGTKILIFATTSSLQVLGIGSRWLGDGTLKVVPSMFTQLYTIHSFVERVWTPGVYSLLSSKQKETYEELLGLAVELIQVELNKTPSPNYVLSDFELSFMKAVKKVFPNTQIFGCLFHFGQVVWRRVQKYGLQSSLSQAKNVYLRSDLHSLISLAFVPVADVKDNFDDLVETIDPSLAMVVAHI